VYIVTHPLARQKEIEREGRRRQVAALLLAGISDQTQIANQLSVTQPTISRDIKAIEAEWRIRAADDIDEAKGKDLQRTERLIQALWGDALKGKWLATDRVLSLMQHRAKLLGLEAPQKREETQRIEISMMVKRIAEEAGLDEAEIMAEAHRILAATS